MHPPTKNPGYAPDIYTCSGVVLIKFYNLFTHDCRASYTNVARQISKSIGIIYKASFCLPTSSLCTLYYSLVYPYLIYCISVWGSTYSSNLNRIFLLQKKVIRIMSRSSYLAHTDPLFKQLKILKLHNLYLFQVGKFMFLFKKRPPSRCFQ